MNERLFSNYRLPMSIDEAGIDCANPINDEFSEIDNAELVAAIEEAQADGIDARVVIQRTIGNEGYSDVEDIFDFTADFSQYCQVGSNAIVFAVSSDDPRAFDVLTSGRADAPYLSGPETDQLIDSVVEDLQNDGSSFQADAAQAIDMVLEHVEAHESPVQEQSPEPVVGQPEKGNDINAGDVLVPVGVGAGLLSAAALVGASGMLISRRRHYNREVREFESRISEITSKVVFSELAAEEVLSPLHENDARGLRELQQELAEESAEFEELASQSLSQWRLQRTIRSRAEDIRESQDMQRALEALARLNDKDIELKTEAERVRGLASELPTTLDGLEQTRLSVHSVLDDLGQLGYETMYYNDRLTEVSRAVARVTALKDSGYVDETHAQAIAVSEILNQLREEVQGVASFREMLMEKEETVLALSSSASDTLLAANTHDEQFVTRYHEAYALESKECLDSALRIKIEMSTLAARVAASHDTKVVAELHERDAHMTRITELAAEFETVMQELGEHQERWQQAEASYDEDVAIIANRIRHFREFTNEFLGDIEPHTVAEVDESVISFEQACAEHEETEKPHHVAISESLANIEARIEAAQRRAKEEKHEMDSLREQVRSYPSKLNLELESAASYARRHSGDVSSAVRSAITGFQIAALTSSSREGMRDIVRDYEAAAREIGELRSRAETQHRDAERRRDAEEAAARRRRAAAAAAASSSSSFSSGGGHKFGGFSSGGGHKGGGF